MEDIKGERRYVRHVKFTGPKAEDIEAKLVYDYSQLLSPPVNALKLIILQSALWQTKLYLFYVSYLLRIRNLNEDELHANEVP